VRYLDAREDRIELTASARDRLVRGGLLLFVVAPLVVIVGWGVYGLIVAEDTMASAALGGGLVALCAVLPGLAGLWTMATAASRAARSRVVIDLDERLITRPGAAPAVFRTPDAVRVAPKGLGWSLRLDGDHPLVLLRHVPRGSGPALADAAEALAEALEVRARVPAAARRARGLVPRDEDLWATLCYAPIDGVNVAYSVLALMTSPSPALRFAAKQSLVSLGVELFFALLLGGCLGVPVIAASAPLALEAAALLCPLAVFTIVRVTIRLVASFHAYRGRAWVMPWLSPITRRWAPDDLRSSDR